MLKMKPRLKNKKAMPPFNPTRSPNVPTSKGNMAPPAIPVHNIPDKEPWCSLTEFKAREKMMDHMTEMKKPIIGNA